MSVSDQPISENDRLDLRQAFESVFESDRLAAIAMHAMPPLDYEQFATKTDLSNLGVALRTEMSALNSELKSEMSELRTELKGEISELRIDLKGEMSEIRTELGELRVETKGDIAQLSLAMANQLRVTVAAQVATMMMLGAWVAAVG